MKKTISKVAIAAVALSLFGGLGVASAASLGITANNTLAAGSSVTASCQTTGNIGVAFGTPTYVAASQTFTVNTVKLTAVSQACGGKNIQVVVNDSTGASLATYSGIVPTTGSATQDLTLTISPVANSANVTGVNVVIYN